jgi:hypothetical protein
VLGLTAFGLDFQASSCGPCEVLEVGSKAVKKLRAHPTNAWLQDRGWWWIETGWLMAAGQAPM